MSDYNNIMQGMAIMIAKEMPEEKIIRDLINSAEKYLSTGDKDDKNKMGTNLMLASIKIATEKQSAKEVIEEMVKVKKASELLTPSKG